MRTTLSQKIGFGLSLFLGLFLAGPSAMGKFADWEGKAQMLDKMGLTIELAKQIGIVEILIAILYIIPRTSFLGAILITGYLGGAVMTHLRVNDHFEFPIILGVIIWIAEGLRNPAVFRLAIGAQSSTAAANPTSQQA